MATSTQSTQYDKIGIRYNSMHELPAVLPERPSVIAALGDIKGKKCLDLACGTGRYTHLLHTLGASSVHGLDISTVMIDGARASYPPSSFPSIHFDVADCSQQTAISTALSDSSGTFDLIFAGWFLNYAGSLQELENMFDAINRQLAPNGRFVGITTNVLDEQMREPKLDFYGVDILVLEQDYRDPDGPKDGNPEAERLGIKARVSAHTDPKVEFDVFQFTKEVYERAAKKSGLLVTFKSPVLPEGNWEAGYWDRWVERPTFVIIEAVRAEQRWPN